MTSRARRKRRARGGDPEDAGGPSDDGFEPSVGGKRTEAFFTYFFSTVVAAGAGAYGGVAIFESMTLAIVGGAIGAVVGFAAAWRGVDIF